LRQEASQPALPIANSPEKVLERAKPRPEHERVATGDWADRLRSEDFWQHGRAPQSGPKATSRRDFGAAGFEPPRRPPATRKGEDERSRAGHFRTREDGSYRTVCVRLCDGYFWPVSFAATRASLENDRRKCERSCETPSKLYVAKDAEAPLEEMKDENGRYYRDLKAAFLYRTLYLESCKCRAHPWEPEAQARHAGYAKTMKSGTRSR
jgi:hypothetical protein